MPNGPLLIVDDEAVNLAVMRDALEPEYRLIFAKSGDDALELAKKFHPSLVITDVEMPAMNGFQLCRRLREIPETRDVPIIFVTRRTDIDAEMLALELGGVDYVNKPINAGLLRLRVQAHLSLVRASKLEQSYAEAIEMLARAGHFNDNDTGVHVWRMADYACTLAKQLGWNTESCRLLRLAAPMHDMGKIGIPHSILKKPGTLTADEWTVMKTHAQIGADILSQSHAPVFQLAAEISLAHHEKWDGSGYPHGLAGTDIPLSARIVAVADVFDALTMRRPYKEAWDINRAIDHIKASSGSHFDPDVVNALNEKIAEVLTTKLRWDAKELELGASGSAFSSGATASLATAGSSVVSPLALVVDDDEHGREILRHDLESNANLRVLTARDGQHALQIMREVSTLPDIILTDVYMPNGDGFELLTQLARKGYRGPIFLMSHVLHILDIARTCGADLGLRIAGCYVKPVDHQSIADAIAEEINKTQP